MTQENTVPTIEERLDNELKETPMSIGDLARLANMSESHLAAIFNGRALSPNQASMRRLRNVIRKYNLTIKPHKWNKFNIDEIPELIDRLCSSPKSERAKARFQPITITHIAHMIGYTRDYISSVLRGKRPLTVQLQTKLNHLYDAMPLTPEEVELREVLLNKDIRLSSNDAELSSDLSEEMQDDLETSADDQLRNTISELTGEFTTAINKNNQIMADMKAVIDLQTEQLSKLLD